MDMKTLKAKTDKANKALDHAFFGNQITAIEYKNAREAVRLSFCRAI